MVRELELNLESKVKLNNGQLMPIFGLGTWNLNGKTAYNTIIWALDSGYRLIDTAMIYGNEREIGKALIDSNVPREEVFITSKVWNTDQGYEPTLKAFNQSLRRLKLKYLDLYLIHWPATPLRNESWKALEKIYDEGLVKSIGVSNFTIRHIKELLATASIKPVVNQFELSPFLYQKNLVDYCQGSEIVVEAYSPLTRGRRLNSEILDKISSKYNKSAAQILLRWALQHNFIVIPKSSSKEHLIENAEIFDFYIQEPDMNILDNLNENFRIGDDPHSMA
jgi:diketogulonate reductase-like aldo/keto reductase